MKSYRIILKMLMMLTVLLTSLPSQAQVVYPTVAIGNAGNSGDVTGFGAVSYLYNIGTYEVSIGQYTEFLNAVASDDTYGLYTPAMGGIPNVAGISRSCPTTCTYSVIVNSGSSANRPVTSVSWFNAARFANWMANGQPIGAQDASTTEDGAYPLFGAVSGNAIPKNSINPNTALTPSFYIPLENEWYKAAFYDPTLNAGAGGYYTFATQSDTTPENSVGSETNQANYLSEQTGYSVNQSPDFSTTQNYLTDGGSYSASSSYYGTYDQNGNVWEWNDLDGAATPSRGLRGGAYTSTPPYLQSTYRMGYVTTGANPNGGFRLATP